MRLNDKELKSIKDVFIKVFGHGELYLFGSRVDDNRRGGDIDLYIIPSAAKDLASKKIDFLVLLKKSIQEQKIDVVIDRGKNRIIDKIAKDTGVLLCRF